MEFTYERNNKDDNIKKDESDKITRLNFLDYICLAMIFDLKKELINSEPSVILCKFLKYPNEKNMKKILKEAFKYSVSFNERNNFWDSDAIKNFEFI